MSKPLTVTARMAAIQREWEATASATRGPWPNPSPDAIRAAIGAIREIRPSSDAARHREVFAAWLGLNGDAPTMPALADRYALARSQVHAICRRYTKRLVAVLADLPQWRRPGPAPSPHVKRPDPNRARRPRTDWTDYERWKECLLEQRE